jgi:hypothetical protein
MPTIVLQNVTGRVLVRMRRLARLHHRSVSDEFRAVTIAQVRRLPAPSKLGRPRLRKVR